MILRREKFSLRNFALFVVSFVVYLGAFLYFAINIPAWQARAAATIIWDGGGNGTSWSDPLNWDTNSVPTSSDDVLIDLTATVVIDQPYTVNSIVIGKAAATVNPVLEFGYDAITTQPFTVVGSMLVNPGATVTHKVAVLSNVTGAVNLDVGANLTVLGNINADGKGYTSTLGPGGALYYYEAGPGASHVGLGGNSAYTTTTVYGGATTTYGSYAQPTSFGSGGGNAGAGAGGTGGGAVKIQVLGDLQISGNITANGNSGIPGSRPAGAGSGGSVWLIANNITGTGAVRATGGAGLLGSTRYSGGGSGGRIAVYYTNSFTLAESQYSAAGGLGAGGPSQKGGVGTIFIKDGVQPNGNLTYDAKTIYGDNAESSNAITRIPNNSVLDTITIKNFSHVLLEGVATTNTLNITDSGVYKNNLDKTLTYSSINWNGGRIIDNGGTLALVSSGAALTIPQGSILEANYARSFISLTVNGLLTHSENNDTEVNKIDISTSGDILISATGSANVNFKGYAPGKGPGGTPYSYEASGGASHAGGGGNSNYGLGAVNVYGSVTQPNNLGSGGGNSGESVGGAGGGVIKLIAGGNFTLNGTLTSNGYSAVTIGRPGGGGAGGSIWVQGQNILGSGNIYANGGNGVVGSSSRTTGGGSGGRIALYYDNSNAITTAQISNVGGNGGSTLAQKGSAGTIFTKSASQTYGNLLLDNKLTYASNLEAKNAKLTILNGYQFDTLTATNYSHLRLEEDLTVNQLVLSLGGTYYNYQNTNLIYTGINWNGGGLVDYGGTFDLIANGQALTIPLGSVYEANYPKSFTSLTVNGLLTHSFNPATEDYKIDFAVSGNTVINSSGSINVNGKGLIGSSGSGGAVYNYEAGGGAAHGGVGGNAAFGLNPAGPGSTNIYGSLTQPVNLGSGGGNAADGSGTSGGGAVKIISGGDMSIIGSITANGINAITTGRPYGAGSGGSIWLSANVLSGTGTITANGGNGVVGSSGRQSGGGAGGRIALYYKELSSFSPTFLTATGGTANPQAQAGAVGTIYQAGIPQDPFNLSQFKTDGETAVAIGGATNQSSFIARLQAKDPSPVDQLKAEIEVRPLASSFTNVPTQTSAVVDSSGSTVTINTTVTGLADGVSYHWQARICDSTDLCSNWVSYGDNAENIADIRVVMNTAPNLAVIPESSFYINAQFTNYLQPSIGFVLSDPNNLDLVKYRFQLATDIDFNNLVVDYTSELAAQGNATFVVGQPEGSGTYTVGAEAQELVTDSYFWRVMTIDDKDAESGWTVAPGNPSFTIDLSRPTNATNASVKAHAAAINEFSYADDPVWFSRNDMVFGWDAGDDDQGVKGYCLYIGSDINADPATNKGLLGTSPISTTGTSCQFLTDDLEIDFMNPALRGVNWLTSSNDVYYFKIKTIDIANNVYVGPDESNVITFKFDNTPPQNVIALSAPSSTFSSTADIFFSWPTSVSQGASDDHSQLLGFQYALNDKNVWYGEIADPTTGLSYIPLDAQQPFYLAESVRDLVNLGQNTIFFRVLDRAGNNSELRTAFVNYGGEAPKFAEGESVTVTPTSNTVNTFSFSWPEAIVSDGNTLATYYYMLNTAPPVSYSTITSNSATYVPTTETSISARSFAGLRKGANTIYVIAVDEAGNYASSNSISGTFTLNTTLPDPATDFTLVDTSIKDASLWRVALIWGAPEYKGTGTLTYLIQRSEDGEDWVSVGETTAENYIDIVSESKQYYWRVGTMDNSDESISNPSFTNAQTVVPRGKYTVPPTLTSGPAVSSITTTRASISWTTNRVGDSKVSLGLGMDNYFDWEPSTPLHKTEHLIPLSNLKPDTTYYFRAKWTDEDGNTGISDELSFKTDAPPDVKNVRVSNLGISTATLTFTTTNANKAKVYYGKTPAFGGFKELATSKLESTYTIQLDNLDDASKYYYQINTFDAENEEYTGTTLDFQTLPRPRVANILVQQVARTAQSSLLVTWESNTDLSSIITYYPESNPELVRDSVDLEFVDGEHKMLLKGLFPDTTYILQVKGRDVIGNEASSQTIRYTTSTDTRAPVISDLTIEGSNIYIADGVNQGTTSQLVVTWTTDEPSTSQVEFGEGASGVYSQLSQEDKNLSYNHVVIISGLTPSKIYSIRAVSKDKASNESRSINTVTITPKATNNAFNLVLTTLGEAFGFLND